MLEVDSVSGATAAEQEEQKEDSEMWWWYNGGAWPWWGWINVIFMIVFWALVVWGVVTLVRHLMAAGPDESGRGGRRPSPEDLLRERFARGEIDADEYRMRLALLREPPVPPGAGRNDAA
jgi:putative membrane protein